MRGLIGLVLGKDLCVGKVLDERFQDNQVQSQCFADRPRLKRTAPRCVRRFGVGNLRHMTQAGFVKMPEQWFQKTPASFRLRSRITRADAYPCFDKGPQQPGPDGALMVTAVTLRDAAFVAAHIPRFVGSERTQAHRRQQAMFNCLNDESRLFVIEKHEWQSADGQDLIGTQSAIDFPLAMIDIDNVVKAPAFLVPEAGAECRSSESNGSFQRSIGLAADPERIQPEGLDFDRLALPAESRPIRRLSRPSRSVGRRVLRQREVHPGQRECRSVCLDCSRREWRRQRPAISGGHR